MKKIFFSSALSIIAILTTSTTHAQDVAGVFIHPSAPVTLEPSAPKGSRVLASNEVNIHALRDFSRKYENAKDIAWIDGEAGVSVYFTFDGAKMRSTYNKSGRREYTLKYYDDASMPKDLRHLIKSNYYDHNIIQVIEVQRKASVSYLVKMENNKEFLTLQVNDGQINVFERLNKAK